MRFEAIRGRSIGPFKDFALDLGGIDGTLVAVCGVNGAGKSTLLELLAGALYRQTPTRGSLTSLATARDAFVEVVAVNGTRRTIRQLVDGVSGKSEALVLDDAGRPVLPSGKVREFDDWASRHLPPESVLYSSSFAPQGRRGFLDLSPAERKRLLVQLLGLERYERMAGEARARAEQARSAVSVNRSRLADMPGVDLERLGLAVFDATSRVKHAQEEAGRAHKSLERAQAAAGDAARAAELTEQRRAADGRLRAARGQLADLERRQGNNRAVLADGEQIRAAVARAADLESEIGAFRTREIEMKAMLEHALRAAQAAKSEHCRACTAEDQARNRLQLAVERLRDKDRVHEAAARAEALRAQEPEYQASIASLERQVAELETLVLSGKDRRIAGLRGHLDLVRRDGALDEPGRSLSVYAAEGLAEDDDLAKAAADAPARLGATRKVLEVNRTSFDRWRGELLAAERLAARAGEIAQAEADQVGALEDLERAHAGVEIAEAARQAKAHEVEAARGRVGEAQAAIETRRRELEVLRPLAEKASILAQAEARIEELISAQTPVRQAITAAELELAALPVLDVERVDLAAYERAAAQADSAEDAARDLLTRARASLEQAHETTARRAALAAEVAADEAELADWTRLAQDLGRDGLQALELDAALPELNAIANDLLHNCHGTRFTVELRSTRLDASGKRELEALDFRVLDTVKGRDADADTFSGGECVIVGEAVSLALTVLACRRAGIERPTLVRDESGAALDAENGRAYVAMLRRAAQQLGADRVLYVSHTPELQELADARIVVEGGKVSVQS